MGSAHPVRPVLRRRAGWLFTAALIALLQVAAPAWAISRMMAPEPLSGAVVCGGERGQQNQPVHDQGCPVCAVFCCTQATAVLPASDAGVPLPRNLLGRLPRTAAAGKPRDPPAVRPRARAPPSFS